MFGVVNNIKVGDNAFGWAGDHVEPGVSIDSENPNEHFALHYLVCTGNKAIVRSGEAKGEIGIVTGEHARNLIHFENKILDKICIGDQIDIGKTVDIKILDKLSSKNKLLNVKVGDDYIFKNLALKVLKCQNSKFDDNPEITTYLQVKDNKNSNNDEVFVFNGWTFSSSPSIQVFDHPVYDLWILKCY